MKWLTSKLYAKDMPRWRDGRLFTHSRSIVESNELYPMGLASLSKLILERRKDICTHISISKPIQPHKHTQAKVSSTFISLLKLITCTHN